MNIFSVHESFIGIFSGIVFILQFQIDVFSQCANKFPFNSNESKVACSTCALVKGNKVVVCNNDDWFCDVAYFVVNPRGATKKTFLPKASKRIQWISKYGSLTINFNFIGNPSGGMNEAGLVIEESWPGPCKYPIPDDRPELDEIQWLQYQFDNCATVDEVIQTDSKLRIRGFFGKSHYFVCDHSGKAAVIEWIDGKMVVHFLFNQNIPVLTNDNYDCSISELKKHEGFGGAEPIGITSSSLDRFCRAADMVQKFATNDSATIVDYGFTILENVSQKNTIFSWVYDVSNRIIYYRTASGKDIKVVPLSGFDFSSNSFNMGDILTSQSGDITGIFTPYTFEKHRNFVTRVVKNWRANDFNRHVSDEDVENMIQYPETMKFATGVTK